jgi:ComF family protein
MLAAARRGDGLRSVAGWVRRLGIGALDLLLPPQCLTCDQPVVAAGLLCAACFRLTGFITPPFCDHCAQPVAHAGQFAGQRAGGPAQAPVCDDCARGPPCWQRARAALRYDEQSRLLVMRLKHADRLELVRPLARMMARAGADLLRAAPVLVPVPLHRRRLLARKFNQSALLARAIAATTGLQAVPDALRRTRKTASLGHLGREARRAEVAGAFAVRPRRAAALVGRRVLLIDDVLTSGATAGACTEALLQAGAAAVDVLVAARVPDRRLG